MMAVTGSIVLVVSLLICWGVMIGGQILFSVGVNNDAKGNYNPNPIMWALLTFFLGWIPAIIYLCVRKNNYIKVICQKCHNMLPEPQPFCPFCSSPIAVPPENPAFIALRERGKKQMIWGAVLIGGGTVLFFVLYFLFIFVLVGIAGAY